MITYFYITLSESLLLIFFLCTKRHPVVDSFSERLRNLLLVGFRPDSIYCYTAIPSCVLKSRADLMGVSRKCTALDFRIKILIVRNTSRLLFHVLPDRWKRECYSLKVICYVCRTPEGTWRTLAFQFREVLYFVVLVMIQYQRVHMNVFLFSLHRKR